jgi:hypothetical protein
MSLIISEVKIGEFIASLPMTNVGLALIMGLLLGLIFEEKQPNESS